METRPAFPVIPGHENVGVIEEIGAEARDSLEFYGRRLDGEGFRAGDTVVVQGAGPLGLTFVLRARVTGAGDIVVVDSSAYRLELAERIGATHTISLDGTTSQERIDRVRELTSGRGADVVVDCAGVPSALVEGLEMARKGGAYIETGAYVETGTAEISPHRHLCSKSIRLIGSTNHPYTGYGPALKLLDLRRAGRLRRDRLAPRAARRRADGARDVPEPGLRQGPRRPGVTPASRVPVPT
jgi:threonine dehydrogenase-like Zn-dependent dehydrogenase